MGSSSKRSDPQTEETVSHRQNQTVTVVGTPAVRSNLYTSLIIAVSTAERNKVTIQRLCPRKKLLRIDSAARQSILI